jgi:hypothetical protein
MHYSTWEVYGVLRRELAAMPLYRPHEAAAGIWGRPAEEMRMLDLYFNNLIPFAETLLEMERRGIALDTRYLDAQQAEAEADRARVLAEFERHLVAGGWVGAPGRKQTWGFRGLT